MAVAEYTKLKQQLKKNTMVITMLGHLEEVKWDLTDILLFLLLRTLSPRPHGEKFYNDNNTFYP